MSKEYRCATNRIVLSAQTRFFGQATATIEATGEREAWQSRRLSRISIEFKNGLFRNAKVEVPPKALEDAGPVHVNRWEFRDEESVRLPGKYLYLVGQAPHQVSGDVWEDKTLHFVIKDAVLQYLSIQVPITKDSWQYVRFDYQGKLRRPEIDGYRLPWPFRAAGWRALTRLPAARYLYQAVKKPMKTALWVGLLGLLGLLLMPLRAEDWTALDGKTYQNVQVLSHNAAYVTILYENGGGRIPLSTLGPALQARFGYDPAKAQAIIAATRLADQRDKQALAKERVVLRTQEDQRQTEAAHALASALFPPPSNAVLLASGPPANDAFSNRSLNGPGSPVEYADDNDYGDWDYDGGYPFDGYGYGYDGYGYGYGGLGYGLGYGYGGGFFGYPGYRYGSTGHFGGYGHSGGGHHR